MQEQKEETSSWFPLLNLWFFIIYHDSYIIVSTNESDF